MEPISGKNPKLGNENDILKAAILQQQQQNGQKKIANGNKSPKVPKGFQASNNAYMLVYTKSDVLDKIRDQFNHAKEENNAVDSSSSSESTSENGKTQKRKPKKRNSTTESQKVSEPVNKSQSLYPYNFPMYLSAYIEQDSNLMEDEIQEAALYKVDELKNQIHF